MKAPAPTVKVIIVDDSEVVRMGLKTLLSPQAAITVAGEAGSVAAAVELATRVAAHVILMDIRLPDGTGFDACRQILRHRPDARVLFLTSVADDKLVDQAIAAGGHGYLLKEINGQGLIRAIQDISEGKSILDPAVTARVLKLAQGGPTAPAPAPLAALSPQELRVLAAIAEGKTNKEIGLDLNLSEKTVKNYLANVFSKLNLSTRTQAAIYYTNHLAK
jgi:two-component system response regulator DevR